MLAIEIIDIATSYKISPLPAISPRDIAPGPANILLPTPLSFIPSLRLINPVFGTLHQLHFIEHSTVENTLHISNQ